MKKVIVLLLVLVIAFPLVACGEEAKAEKHCFSCGEDITKDAMFCEHCGATVGESKTENEDNYIDNVTSTESEAEETSNPTQASKPTETSKPTQMSTPTKTNKPNETSESSSFTHVHSYSKKITAATCIEYGYTTYTCTCGDYYISDYVNVAPHSFSNYSCSVCGIADKEHAYEYLMYLVLSKGTTNLKTGTIDYVYREEESEFGKYTCLAGLTYNPESDDICAWSYYDYPDMIDSYALIYLDDFYYERYSISDSNSGYIDPSTFRFDPFGEYEQDYSQVYSAVGGLEIFLIDHTGLHIQLADLGLTAY